MGQGSIDGTFLGGGGGKTCFRNNRYQHKRDKATYVAAIGDEENNR